MPSATTSRPRVRPRSIRICDEPDRGGLVEHLAMKQRSILRMSTGSCRSRTSDQYPVPKSSMAMRTPSPRSPPDLRDDHVGRRHRALGDLEHEALRPEAGPGEHVRDLVDQTRVVELSGREVHGDAPTSSGHSAACWHALAAAPTQPIAPMSPVSSASGMNRSGPSRPRWGAASARGPRHSGGCRRPARARAGSGGAARRGRRPRPGRRAATSRSPRRVVHVRFEQGQPALAGGLGPVHGDVGAAQQLLGRPRLAS